MASPDFTFSSTLEMENFIGGEYPVTLCGYIEDVGQAELVGSPKRYLKKCILNNGDGGRMRLLFWGKQAEQYDNKIVKRMIVHVTIGRISDVKDQWFKPEEGLPRIEYYVTPQSVVSLGALYEIPEEPEQQSVDKHKDVALEDCADEEGLIGVEGYLKELFCPVDTKNSSYGLGVIAKGQYKMSVQINRFQENQAFKLGSHIHVKGRIIINKYGARVLQVVKMADISVIDDTVLPLAQLKLAVLPAGKLKRTATNGSTADERKPDSMEENGSSGHGKKMKQA